MPTCGLHLREKEKKNARVVQSSKSRREPILGAAQLAHTRRSSTSFLLPRLARQASYLNTCLPTYLPTCLPAYLPAYHKTGHSVALEQQRQQTTDSLLRESAHVSSWTQDSTRRSHRHTRASSRRSGHKGVGRVTNGITIETNGLMWRPKRVNGKAGRSG